MTDDRTAPRLTVAAVAARLGIAPATLRTWDRRYGLGPSTHTAGAHRRYDAADLGRLESMRRLVLAGVAPGDAARAVLGDPATASTDTLRFPDRTGHLPSALPGAVVELPGAADLVRGLSRAARALDSEAVCALLRDLLAQVGVQRAWEQVLVPALVAVGEHWASAGDGVEVEHLLSDCVASSLLAVPPASGRGRPVLLACAPGELHSLPLMALRAALAEQGVPSRLLGAAVPAEALLAALRRTGAAALFVWSQLPASGSGALLAALPVSRPPTAVVIGGPGWGTDIPERVSRAQGLGAALDLLGRAVRGEALASSS